MTRGLQAFTFELERDGDTRSVTFYATSLAAALRLVQAWASERGWTLPAA